MKKSKPCIELHDEVATALAEHRPVVALETAVVTHGLPRESIPELSHVGDVHWDAHAPANIALILAMERCVRAVGAVPATMALLDGTLRAGLSDHDLDRLGSDRNALKLSSRDLGAAIANRATGGLTVAATLTACLASGVKCFATGGIGGVHQGWAKHLDVSADLAALANAPVVVVCAGAKNILDLPATLECLDSLGVPVLGLGTQHFPCFTCVPDVTLPVAARVETPRDVAAAAMAHWKLGLRSAVLTVQPCPKAFALERQVFEQAMESATQQARDQRISGAALTPFLLATLCTLTHGKSLQANVALLLANAATAAEVSKNLLDLEAAA